jgi:parallel beta-helix repeat protein
MHGFNNLLHKIGSVTIFFILIFVFFNVFINVEICKGKDGNILYVGGSGIGNYTTIQEAIDNSTDDDTVYVYSGTYNENLVINKSINLIGLDEDSTFIRGNGSLYIILIKSSWVNVTKFSIQNGKVGVYIPGLNYSFNNITNNIITNNWEGIRLYSSSNNKISGNVISDHSNFGIILYESRNNLITENTLMDNSNAIFLSRWSDNNVIYENNLTENLCGISLASSFNNLIYENYIINNSRGVFLSCSDDNNISYNNIEFNDESGIYLSYSDDNIISSNTFSNNYQNIKQGPKPPKIKAPGFEIFFVICAILFTLFLRKKAF